MKIAVTGGTGFLGKHVCRELEARGHNVHGFGYAKAFDLMDRDDADAIACATHTVVHLAAYCGGIGENMANPVRMFTDNMTMGMNILRGCHIHKVPIVMVGTICGYPETPPRIPFVEADMWSGYPEPTNAPYGVAKRALWTLAKAYHDRYGLKFAYLNLANLYGPGDNFGEGAHVIPDMIRKMTDARNCHEKSVTLWGTGEPTRDFLYVRDAARAIADTVGRLGEIDPNPINVGTGHEVSMRDLAKMVAEKVGYFGDIQWDTSKPNGQPRRCLDVSRAREALGWSASVDLNAGLAATVAHYNGAEA